EGIASMASIAIDPDATADEIEAALETLREGLYPTEPIDLEVGWELEPNVDDVINVAGHRLGTKEIESCCLQVPEVAEAAVVPRKDEMKGKVPDVYIALSPGFEPSEAIEEAVKNAIEESIGKIARPNHVYLVPDIPKTRSGKIMRRVLSALSNQSDDVGDVTTLMNQEENVSKRMDLEEETFANSLVGHMKAKGISQVELAAAIGVGQPAISMMLSRDCRPQRRTVEKLARALGVPPNDLWPGFGSPDNALAGDPAHRPSSPNIHS
ncbi:MAG: helix-turn-helix domain-containing protein, partial [Isosphaeraceae bacterium]